MYFKIFKEQKGMKTFYGVLLIILFYVLPLKGETLDCKIIVSPLEKSKCYLFPLSEVRLLDGPFKRIQDLDHDYLLSLEPDRLLSWFRREAGLTSKAKAYPFWESEDVWGGGPLSGHILGFYLSSMAMMYGSTGDERIIERLNYVVEQLSECQEAQGDGYISAIMNGKQLFEFGVANGFKVDKATINGVWEPIYTMNKTLLGLYNVYMNCNIAKAKEVMVKLADWFGHEVLDKLTSEEIQNLLLCEHGSINESFVDVYSVTGDKKYLKWAQLLNDEDMWIPASKERDILNGWHANTQIPKFTGFERVYTYTREKEYHNAATFFWNTVVNKHTWAIGGNSTGEHFFPVEEFEKRITDIGGPESCNSVNMMRLTEALYCNDAGMEKVDYYERVLFNHILANYDPIEGMCTYFTSMRPSHYRIYGTKYHSFWCCTGTGMEAPAKFGKMIYAHSDSNLFVNLFIPSRLQWKEKEIVLEQKTTFPDNKQVILEIIKGKDVYFDLNIRCPYWLKSSKIDIIINGKRQVMKSNDRGYIQLSRQWNAGDKIILRLEPKLSFEYLKGSEKYVALLYGPIVLAAEVDNYNDLKYEDDFRLARRTVASEKIPMLIAPALIGNIKNVIKNIRREEGTNLVFTCSNNAASYSFKLLPFNRIHFSRYAVYFPIFKSENEYQYSYLSQKDEISEIEFIEKHTVDRVRLYSPDSEKEHKLDGVDTNIGDAYGCTWRHALNGGYFMYEMKVIPHKQQYICLKFIRTDEGNRVFDIFVDGQKVTTIDHCIPKEKSRLFYYEIIPIPLQILSKKNNITIKLQAKVGNIAGGIFDLRILDEKY